MTPTTIADLVEETVGEASLRSSMENLAALLTTFAENVQQLSGVCSEVSEENVVLHNTCGQYEEDLIRLMKRADHAEAKLAEIAALPEKWRQRDRVVAGVDVRNPYSDELGAVLAKKDGPQR